VRHSGRSWGGGMTEIRGVKPHFTGLLRMKGVPGARTGTASRSQKKRGRTTGRPPSPRSNGAIPFMGRSWQNERSYSGKPIASAKAHEGGVVKKGCLPCCRKKGA